MSALAISKAQERNTSPFKTVPRRNETELQTQDGEVHFWVDKLGRTHSPDVMLQQQGYNEWLRGAFGRDLISFMGGGGVSPPAGIQLVPAQPPGERGISSSGAFQVPETIRANGVLTRDTVSIQFYKSGIQWNSAARQLLADCKGVHDSNDFSIDCSHYEIGWRTTDRLLSTEKDPFMLAKRFVELQKAKAALREWQALLDSITTVTARGQKADAIHDRQESDARKRAFGGDYDADHFTNPPDWLTAQVDAKQLTPAFLQRLADAEKDVLEHLSAEHTAHDLGQDKARQNRTNQ